MNVKSVTMYKFTNAGERRQVEVDEGSQYGVIFYPTASIQHPDSGRLFRGTLINVLVTPKINEVVVYYSACPADV